jgi:hypothetical protein
MKLSRITHRGVRSLLRMAVLAGVAVLAVAPAPALAADGVRYVTYFAFSLPNEPTPDAAVGTFYAAGSADSGVHPRLAWGPQTQKGAAQSQYYSDGQVEGFSQSMSDLWAGNGWRLGAEKLSSPLGSLQTAWYSVTFIP